jgi:hypothetical protein
MLTTTSSDFFGEIVDMVVGSANGTKTSKIHKGALCHYSGYFDKALNGGFSEARAGRIELLEEEIDIFERFVVWLYTGRLNCESNTVKTFTIVCKLWILADRRDIPLLMNVSVNAMRDEIVSSCTVPTTSPPLIFAQTTEKSALRRYAILVIARCGTAKLLNGSFKSPEWPQQALSDTLELVWGPEGLESSPWEDRIAGIDMCEFHSHDEGVSCPKEGPSSEIFEF